MSKSKKYDKTAALDRDFEKLLFRMRQREILNHIPVRSKIINGRLVFLVTIYELSN